MIRDDDDVPISWFHLFHFRLFLCVSVCRGIDTHTHTHTYTQQGVGVGGGWGVGWKDTVESGHLVVTCTNEKSGHRCLSLSLSFFSSRCPCVCASVRACVGAQVHTLGGVCVVLAPETDLLLFKNKTRTQNKKKSLSTKIKQFFFFFPSSSGERISSALVPIFLLPPPPPPPPHLLFFRGGLWNWKTTQNKKKKTR